MFDYRLEEDASRFAVFYENEEIGEISFVKTGEHLLIIDHTYVDAKWKGHAIMLMLWLPVQLATIIQPAA